MAYDWTTPYSQWDPTQQQEAQRWLNTQMQGGAGNWGNVYNTTKYWASSFTPPTS